MKNNDLHCLFRELIELNKEQYRYLGIEIEKIINNKIKDEKYIEKILDGMLDVLFSYETEETLSTFRKLCKYYYGINPKATSDYIKFYMEINDIEEIKTLLKQ